MPFPIDKAYRLYNSLLLVAIAFAMIIILSAAAQGRGSDWACAPAVVYTLAPDVPRQASRRHFILLSSTSFAFSSTVCSTAQIVTREPNLLDRIFVSTLAYNVHVVSSVIKSDHKAVVAKVH